MDRQSASKTGARKDKAPTMRHNPVMPHNPHATQGATTLNLIITMKDSKGKNVPVNLATSTGATLAAPFMLDRIRAYGKAENALIGEYADACRFTFAVTRKDLDAHNSEMGRLFYLTLYKAQGVTTLPMLFEMWETGRDFNALPAAEKPAREKYLRYKYDRMRHAGGVFAGEIIEPKKDATRDDFKAFVKYVGDKYAGAVKAVNTADQYNGIMRALSATLTALAARKVVLGLQDAPDTTAPDTKAPDAAPDTKAPVQGSKGKGSKGKGSKGKARTR